MYATAATSSYVQETITTSRGKFPVKYIKINLDSPSLKIYSLAGSSGECLSKACATKPLAEYVKQVNGFAAIHGSYFCPPDYAACKGKNGSFYWLWYNSLNGAFSNSFQNKFNDQGSVLAIGTNNQMYPYARSPLFKDKATFESTTGTGLQAAVSNGPALVVNGQNVTEQYAMDTKQRTVKGARGALGYKGRDMYLVTASSATVIDMGAVMQAMGMDYALNLDGGGSTALWYNGEYKVGPGRLLPNALVFADPTSAPVKVADPTAAAAGKGFFAYDAKVRSAFSIAAGDVVGDNKAEILMGSGPGLPPEVKIFDASGTLLGKIAAFEQTRKTGVRIAACNLFGDEKAEVVVGESVGQVPRIRVLSASGSLLANFVALATGFRGGLNIACGDVTGDRVNEIIVAPGAGNFAQVFVYSATGTKLASFFPYAATHAAGIRLAVANMDDDPAAEIVIGTERGAPHMLVFKVTGSTAKRLGPGFFAFNQASRNGIDVAVADIDGDGKKEYVVVPGKGDAPLIKVYSISGDVTDSFYAFAPTFLGGTRLTGADVDGDGKDEVIVVPDSNGGPQIRILKR